jgi:tetratricopeptide (TPR) repeat protein
MNSGDYNGANAMLQATFPQQSRTAAECFVLGNVLFEIDPRDSHGLHEAAAKAEPQNSSVAWEWGLEQHRAGDYAGALKSYQAFSDARPQCAGAYALQADCLLHLNRIDQAIEAWHKSESAPDGTVETMEELVCAVHREPAPFERRAVLLARAMQKRDADAAADLIALDCDFPRDWWNSGPYEAFLSHDLPAVTMAMQLGRDDPRARAMACAAECARADHDDAAAVKKILTANRILLDANQTIPTHGGLLSVILGIAVESQAIDETTLRRQIGPTILALAEKSHNAMLWNVAAFAGPSDHPDKLLELERDGWAATGDARFAAGVLYLKLQQGRLKDDDSDLRAALKQFPQSGLVQRAMIEVAVRDKTVTRSKLAAAAQAEFAHFSSFVAPATVVNRPRSDYLRQYFAMMLRIPATIKPAGKS